MAPLAPSRDVSDDFRAYLKQEDDDAMDPPECLQPDPKPMLFAVDSHGLCERTLAAEANGSGMFHSARSLCLLLVAVAAGCCAALLLLASLDPTKVPCYVASPGAACRSATAASKQQDRSILAQANHNASNASNASQLTSSASVTDRSVSNHSSFRASHFKNIAAKEDCDILYGMELTPGGGKPACRSGHEVVSDAECQIRCAKCEHCNAWVTDSPEAELVTGGPITCWMRSGNIQWQVSKGRNGGLPCANPGSHAANRASETSSLTTTSKTTTKTTTKATTKATTSSTVTTTTTWKTLEPEHPLPDGLTGVNFGSWLCLEDWFFSGGDGQYVDSNWLTGQGSCLVPEKEDLGFVWKSEGGLTKRLGDKAAEVIGAHRRSFITEADFAQASKLGVKTIRIPITWAAFADALAEFSPEDYGRHDPDTEEVPVPDPFYHEEIAMLTIPRDFLRTILDWARAHHVKVIWDIHAYMGGSSNGTFNGVWPRVPTFWQESFKLGDTTTRLSQAGMRVAHALIKWTEGLDEERLSAVAGLTLMNEPAHLSWGGGWCSKDLILDWLAGGASLFRESSLPSKGVRLYVNLVETAFGNWGGDFAEYVPGWYNYLFTPDERREWAVMDLHKYYSWDPTCSGCDGGQCAWDCSNSGDSARGMLRQCIQKWAEETNKLFDQDMLKAVSEFSTSTFRDATVACRDEDLARGFLEEQVEAFRNNGIEGFFWSWRIPYGPIFQSGWSLKYLAGVEEKDLEHVCMAPSDRVSKETVDEA